MAKRYTEEQVIAELKEAEAGAKTTEICRKHGVSDAITSGSFIDSAKFSRKGMLQNHLVSCQLGQN